MSAHNFHYHEYQRLLVELHALVAARKNQSPEARKLRQDMEASEANLSEEEIVRLNELSSDLSMIHNREIPDSDVLALVSRDEVPHRIHTAFKSKNWRAVLQLLRTDVSHLWKPAQIAYLRSRAYEGLGELTPAIAFMDEAVRRAPENVNYRALALRLIWEAKRYQEAFSRARDYLADSNTKPRLILMSGGIVAQELIQPTLSADLTTTAKLALSRMQDALPRETSPNVAFAGYVALGLLAVYLDNSTTAAGAFDAALAVGSEQYLTSNPALYKELEFIRSGKSKSVEERANATQLAEFANPALLEA